MAATQGARPERFRERRLVARAEHQPRSHRLPALHLGQHRHPQGRHGCASQCDLLPGLHGRPLWRDRRRPLLAALPHDLRPVGVRHVRLLGERRLAVLPITEDADEARPVHRGHGADGVVLGALDGDLHEADGHAQGRPVSVPAAEPVLRRSPAAGAGVGVAQGGAGGGAGESLWPDGTYDRLHALSLGRREHAAGRGAGRGSYRRGLSRHDSFRRQRRTA